MSSNERRVDTRINIRVPLRFRSLNIPNSAEQTAESENISQRGIYFETEFPLKIGTPLEVSLRMPRELAERLRSEEHTSELQSHVNLVCRLLLEKKKKNKNSKLPKNNTRKIS